MRELIFTISLFLCSILSFNLQAQDVIINEYGADAGNYDGKGGEWLELKNISASPVDLSCWFVSNGGNLKTVIPSGLILPAGSILLIASQSDMMCATCDFPNLDNAFTTATAITGLKQGTGSYANSYWLNFDNCNCNVGSQALNNNPTGDRAVLFDSNLNIVDAIQVGGGDNYGTAAITVNVQALGTCGVRTATIPEVGNSVYANTTVCNDQEGCNSSYSRATVSTWYNASNIVGDQLLSCGSGDAKAVDHPTPGLENIATAFDYSLSGSISGSIVNTPVVALQDNKTLVKGSNTVMVTVR